MRKADRIKYLVFWLVRLLLVSAVFFAIYKVDYINLALAVFTLVLTFLPSLIEHKLKVDYPSEFEILILFFLTLSMYFGEIQSFYHVFWWWDIFLHGLSGIIIGLIGFSLVYFLNSQEDISVLLSPVFIAVFSFCFAVSIGIFWEIFEFFMDSTFGLNMQKSGLVDTMWDLIVDAAGAFIISILGYLYIKKGNFRFAKYIKKRK